MESSQVNKRSKKRSELVAAAASAAHAASSHHVVWVVAVLPAPPCTAPGRAAAACAPVSTAPGAGRTASDGPAGGSPVGVETSPVKPSTWNRNGSRRLGSFWRFAYGTILEPNDCFGQVCEQVVSSTFCEVDAIRTNYMSSALFFNSASTLYS